MAPQFAQRIVTSRGLLGSNGRTPSRRTVDRTRDCVTVDV
jgi:hypothetical protein